MCKYIIFLVFLVPPRQALQENPSTDKPDLSTKLFSEIDEYLIELILSNEATQKHESLCSANWESLDFNSGEGRNFKLAPMVKAKFKVLEKHLHSRNLVKECPNMENYINEYRNSLKIEPKTVNNIANNLNANVNINLSSEPPAPVHRPSKSPAPDQTHAICTPSGENQQELNCVFPNKTTIVIPIRGSGNNNKLPGQSPSEGGDFLNGLSDMDINNNKNRNKVRATKKP